MGEKMKLSLIQMNSGSFDVKQNVDKAAKYVTEATKKGAEVIVIPEFFNTPYFCQYRDYKYMDYAERGDGYSISAMRDLAKTGKVYVVATIFEEEAAGLYFDTAFVIDPEGNIVGKFRKIHPSAVKGLEKIYFRPGNRFPIFEILGWKVGIMICYDFFFPETARVTAVAGAELILGPFATFAYAIWESMMRTRAYENGIYLAPCNKVGPEGDYVFSGDSMVVSPMGVIEARASGSAEEILITEIDRSVVFDARRKLPIWRDRRPEVYKSIGIPEEMARGLI